MNNLNKLYKLHENISPFDASGKVYFKNIKKDEIKGNFNFWPGIYDRDTIQLSKTNPDLYIEYGDESSNVIILNNKEILRREFEHSDHQCWYLNGEKFLDENNTEDLEFDNKVNIIIKLFLKIESSARIFLQ